MRKLTLISLLILGFLIGVSVLSALAQSSSGWTPPTATPPGGNVPAPINIGNVVQEKLGGLSLRSGLVVYGNLIVATGTGAGTKGKVLTAMDDVGTVAWGTGGSGTLPSCTEGQTLKMVSGSWTCKDIDSFYAVGEVYFGGMYGSPDGAYSNPLASNTKSCPTGYKAYRLLGTYNVDHDLYFCAGDPNKVSKVAEFGGVYSSLYNNPLTNAKSCPSGYTSKRVLGTYNVDNDLYFCYNLNLSNPVIRAFGGMYGAQYFNPLTGGSGCFIQYDNSTVFGQTNVDYAVGICYAPKK